MTRKEQILRMVERLPDDVSYDRVMYHLTLMDKVERGNDQIERGDGIGHEDLEAELQAEECHETVSSGPLKGKQTSKTSAATSHGTRPARRRR